MDNIYIPKLSSVYLFVWGSAIILYALNMITMLSGISFLFLSYVFLIPLVLIYSCEVFFSYFSRHRKSVDTENFAVILNSKKGSIFLIYYFWCTLSLIDVLVSGFLPLFSGAESDLNYTDYGVKGLGGVNNSLALALSFSLGYLFIFKINTKKSLFFLLSISAWQVLTLRRGILFSIIFIFLILFLISYRKKIKFLTIKMLLTGIGLITIFGMLGDARGLKSPFNPLVRETYTVLFEWLPSGFLWVYVYITSSLENLNNNLGLIFGTCQDIFYPILGLAPSVIRPEVSCPFVLQIDYLNVGTYLAHYVVTGNIIAFLFYLLIPIFFTTFSRTMFLRTRNIGYLGVYAILLLCWLLSPFTNLFFLPTYILAPIILLSIFIIKMR